MLVYELTRKILVGSMTIQLWLDADELACEECEERADELALCASTLADEDDLPLILANKLITLLNGINAVEITDENGNGAVARLSFLEARE